MGLLWCCFQKPANRFTSWMTSLKQQPVNKPVKNQLVCNIHTRDYETVRIPSDSLSLITKSLNFKSSYYNVFICVSPSKECGDGPKYFSQKISWQHGLQWLQVLVQGKLFGWKFPVAKLCLGTTATIYTMEQASWFVSQPFKADMYWG